MKKGIIYKITNPNNKIYIGQTVNLYNRVYKYKNLLCKRQPKLYNSIKKYGWDNHTIEIIDEIWCGLNNNIINIREKYWIREYDSMNVGLNCNEGGDNKVFTEETRLKMRNSQLGKIKGPRSESVKNKISEKLKGHKLSEETKEKIRQSLKGRPNPRKGKKLKK